MLAFTRYPGARAYFMAATVSRMSRDMFETAVVLFVLAKTDNPAVAGSMVAASLIPSAILGPMLGVWMDRSAHRRLILGANQVLLGISLVAILFSAGRLPDPALILFAVLAGATGPLHTGGFTSLLSVLFPRQWLPQANAAETTSFNASGIAAPALAALIIAVGNVDLAVTAQAFIAIAAIGWIGKLPPIPANPDHGDRSGNFARTITSGVRHILRKPRLREASLVTTVAMIGLGLLIIVFPFYSEELIGNTNATGLMWASFAIGSTAGAVLTAGLQQRIGPDLMVAGGMALMGFSVLLWPLAPNLWVALPLVGLTGLGDGPSLAALFSVRQRDTPPPLLAQVFTTASSLKLAAFAVGSALAAPIIENWGVEGAVAVAAAMHLAPTAAWLVFWPREEGPAQAEA